MPRCCRSARTVGEAVKLDLPPDLMDNYLYGNAQRFFFDRLDGASGAASPPIEAAEPAQR